MLEFYIHMYSILFLKRPATDILKLSQCTLQILTDNFLKVLGDSSGSLYALGDCAEIETLPLPCTAQVVIL